MVSLQNREHLGSAGLGAVGAPTGRHSSSRTPFHRRLVGCGTGREDSFPPLSASSYAPLELNSSPAFFTQLSPDPSIYLLETLQRCTFNAR